MPDLNEYAQEVMENSERWGFNVTPSYNGILMESLCLCGEVGEFANIIKKLPRTLAQRNGITEEQLLAQAREELIDVLIYFCKLSVFLEMNIEEEWKQKQTVLHKRWRGEI